jgi:transposase
MKAKDEDLKIAMSIPGVVFVSGSTLIAEIGNYRGFKTPDKLASWTGIVSSVYQSADKLSLGRIIKRGSKHLRRILVEVAQAVIKVKGKEQTEKLISESKSETGIQEGYRSFSKKNPLHIPPSLN